MIDPCEHHNLYWKLAMALRRGCEMEFDKANFVPGDRKPTVSLIREAKDKDLTHSLYSTLEQFTIFYEYRYYAIIRLQYLYRN